MRVRQAIVLLSLIVFGAPAHGQQLGGQVVFSRRVYRLQGRSYQEIWSWNPATGALVALTHSARDHYAPDCKDGEILFQVPQPGPNGPNLWSFDPRTRAEKFLGPAPMVPEQERPKNGCTAYAQAGALEACGNDEDLTVSRAGKPVGQFHIQENICVTASGVNNGPCATPILGLEWSPDAKWLLVNELGLDTNSTAPQSDYYVVNPGTMKLSKAVTADQGSAVWLPASDKLLYVTPRDLAILPGGRRERTVWSQHLMLFDPETKKTTALTSGVTNDVAPSLCER